MASPLMGTVHDCEVHHRLLPVPDIITPNADRRAIIRHSPEHFRIFPNSYGSAEIMRGINAIVDDTRPHNSTELGLRYDIVSNYLSLPNIQKASLEELRSYFQHLAVQLDEFFFQGALLSGPEPYVKLVVLDVSSPHGNGFHRYMQYVPNRIFIYLRNHSSGKRRPKTGLLTTVVHELIHAYLAAFFNFCPVNGEIDLVVENQGHGQLFRDIYRTITLHLRTWHPSLITVARDTDSHAGSRFRSAYYGLWGKLPWLRREWDVSNLRDSPRKAEFKRALLELTYDNYHHFLSTRVPRSLLPQRLWIGFIVLTAFELLVAAELVLVWLVKGCYRLVTHVIQSWN